MDYTYLMLVEQNAKVALELAHVGYVMEVGRIVMDDTAERLMESEDIKAFYLGHQEEGARGERRWKRKKTWPLAGSSFTAQGAARGAALETL